MTLTEMIKDTYITELQNRTKEVIKLRIQISEMEVKYGRVYRGISNVKQDVKKLRKELIDSMLNTDTLINTDTLVTKSIP